MSTLTIRPTPMTRSAAPPAGGRRRAALRNVLAGRSLYHPLILRLALLVAGAAAVTLTVCLDNGERTRDILRQHWGGRILALTALAYWVFAIAVNGIRLVLVLRYRPVQAPCDEDLPTITVIVPAYNEGELVRHTLHSLASSNYPADKVQLIAVDDGSADDTWRHIRQAAGELVGRVHALRCRRNRGKRWALYEGFRRARGQYILTVDSDSTVEPDTLRNMVAPMVADPAVGAVAGNVKVLNREAGIIPRLLSVSFVFAFDFVRAAESMMGSVLCTPGALSAYRTSCIRPVLDRWLHQTYMGRECSIGEDRALTNMILRQGHEVRYQSNAAVLTKVPVRLRGLRRMFTRWARSDVRESIAFARFGFGPFRQCPRWQMALTRMNFLAKSLSTLIGWPMLVALLALAVLHPVVIGLKLLSGAVIGSLWSMAVCFFRGRRIDAPLAMVYSLFWLAALWWITPWGLFTSHRGGWLTRAAAASGPRRRRMPLPMVRGWVRVRRTVRQALSANQALARLTHLIW
jgi:hyaluronan synthase